MARPLEGTTVAITGATGFLGTHVACALAGAGAVISALTRPGSDRGRLDACAPRWVEGSVEQPASLDRLAAGCRVFVHVAGIVVGRRWEEFERVNVAGTRHALAAADRAGAETFILISSQAAGGPTPTPGPARREEDPPDPRSLYGRSKRAAEEALAASPATIPRRVVLRPGAIYGAYDRAFLSYFRMVQRGWRVVLGDGARVFQAVCAPDVAETVVAAAVRAPVGVSTYYVVPPTATSWEEFGRAVEIAVGRRARRIVIPDWIVQPAFLELLPPLSGQANRLRDLLPRRWEADPSLAREELGWTARTPLSDGLRRTWDWYRGAGWA